MIKSIEIKNFESHADTEIEFHPGVNVIVGRTDAGKSSIMRALRWIFFNKPVGDSYIRYGTKTTAVNVDLDNGQLARVRENAFNGYVLGFHDEYKGFSHQIPEPVSNFINMSSINYQQQMESPFMLSWTAGQCGSFINETVNLESMDIAVSNIKRKISEETKSIEYNSIHIEQIEKELEAFEDLEEIEKLIEDLENKQNRWDYLSEKYLELSDIIENIEAIQENIEYNEESLRAQRSVTEACKILDRYKTLQKEAYNLEGLIRSLYQIDKNIKHWSKEIEQSTKEFNKLMPDVCPLCGE